MAGRARRKIDWIVSDHACCAAEQKWAQDDPENIWLAKSGFGGTEYLLSGVLSEGSKRGLSYNRMAELLSWNPARRFGLLSKATSRPAWTPTSCSSTRMRASPCAPPILNPSRDIRPSRARNSPAGSGATFLRGALVYHDGKIIGPARGRYLRRPVN